MAKLFGREYTKQQLLEKVGSVAQLAEARRVILTAGKRAGCEAVMFRTGSGLSFMVLPGRALDIADAEYQGMSLCFRTPVGEVHAAYYEPEELGWLRSFFAGLLTTGGLSWCGHPSEDPEGGAEAHSGLGLHGRISNIPAENVYVDGAWEGDDYVMWAQGKMREAMLFGPNLVLTRKVSARLGESKIWLHDVVTNEGFVDQEHMILYHVNLGFPLLDECSEYLLPALETLPHNEFSAQFTDEWSVFAPPDPHQEEMCYYHRLAAQPDGTTCVALVNRELRGGQGLGLYMKFDTGVLPWLVQWKMPGAGTYVTGIEPATSQGYGRAAERQAGRVVNLAPGQARTYELEFGVLTSQAEIAEIEETIKSLTQ